MLVDLIRSFNNLRELILINAATEPYMEGKDVSLARDQVELNTGT